MPDPGCQVPGRSMRARPACPIWGSKNREKTIPEKQNCLFYPAKKTSTFFHTNIYPVLAQLHRPVRKVITFARYITSISHIKLISMYGAHYVAQRIDKPVGQYAAGMRTFIGKSKHVFAMAANTDRLPVGLRHGNIVAAKIQLVDMLRHLVPVLCSHSLCLERGGC